MTHIGPFGDRRSARPLARDVGLAMLLLACSGVSCIEGQAPRADPETRDATGQDVDTGLDGTTPDADGLVADTTADADPETLGDTRADGDEVVSGDTLVGDTPTQTDTAAPSCDPPCRNGGVCTSTGTCSCAEGCQGPTCEVPACGGTACPALPGYTPGCRRAPRA